MRIFTFFSAVCKKMKKYTKNLLTNAAFWYIILTTEKSVTTLRKGNCNGTQICYDDGYDDGHVYVHVYDDARPEIVIIVSLDHPLYQVMNAVRVRTAFIF